ncbi:hypothetical protein [Marinimicrobium locisalis]|uniref:LuxE/PaaK family acyltransferase n=1 Tax=Marinimicrobium locisalis TaxID=546022 RepID=UPI003221F6BC
MDTDLHSHIRQSGLDPLKVLLGSVSELFQLDDNTLENIKFYVIKEAFYRHYNNNDFYRNSCKEKNIHPDDIKQLSDLVRIPLVPIELYKANDSHKLLSVSLNDVELEMRSTGTSGIPSVSRRCSDTVDHAVFSIYAMYREFFSISKGAGLYLCPSTEEIPEMGMIKALNMLAGLLDTHRFMVEREQFVPEEVVDQIHAWENRFSTHIIGPPFLINRFIRYLKARNIKLSLDKSAYVITLGGWKRFSGEMLSREEFNRECVEFLGVKEHQIRDIYALVESNVMAIDDEFGEKHVTPYIHFSVRDPEHLDQEVPEGEVGQLAILDPLAKSTPGFMLTEDMVRLLPGKSRSGRSGQRVQYVMRKPEAKEFGCCAVNLDKKLEEVEADEPNCPVVS